MVGSPAIEDLTDTLGWMAVICQYGNGEVVCRAGISPRGVATDPAG